MGATTRLIAIHLAFTFLSAALVLSVVHGSAVAVIEAEADETLIADLHGLVDAHAAAGPWALGDAIRRRIVDPHAAAHVYLLATANGAVIAGNIASWPVFDEVDRRIGPSAMVVRRAETKVFRTDQGRWVPIRAVTTELPDGERVLVGRDAQSMHASDQTLEWALLVGLGLILTAGFLTGWSLSRFILRRLDEVSATARRVMGGDLSTRVPDHDLGNEFDRLAGLLNDMFDRMEALVGDLRMTTDSLAHDLRSPLSRLRNHLNEALCADPGSAEQEERIARALREADEMVKILAALLEISRAEAGVGRDQFTAVDLAALVRNVVDLFDPTADDRAVALTVVAAAPEVVSGHPQLLFLALSNLVDNALKFAPAGSEVGVSVQRSGAAVSLSVVDRGPGIAAEDRARVVQRFVRLSPARSGSGAGLGLALVAAVASLHQADLVLSDNAPGLIATIRFPDEMPAAI